MPGAPRAGGSACRPTSGSQFDESLQHQKHSHAANSQDPFRDIHENSNLNPLVYLKEKLCASPLLKAQITTPGRPMPSTSSSDKVHDQVKTATKSGKNGNKSLAKKNIAFKTIAEGGIIIVQSKRLPAPVSSRILK